MSIVVEEKAWERMIVDGAPEATTFKMGGPELNTVHRGARKGRCVGNDLGRGRVDDSQNDKIGFHRLHRKTS